MLGFGSCLIAFPLMKLKAKAPPDLSRHPGLCCTHRMEVLKMNKHILSLCLLRYSRISLNILWGAISGQNPNQERAGIPPLPVTLQAACSNTCHQIQGDELPRKLSFRDTNSPPDLCHRNKAEYPITKQQKLLLPLSVQLGTYEEPRPIRKKKNPESRTVGTSGEQHTRECKSPLAQFHTSSCSLDSSSWGLSITRHILSWQSIPILKLESEANFREILEGKGNLHALSKNNKGKNNAQNA